MSWASDAVFYHVYPLGMFGAPKENDFASLPVSRLSRLHDWLGHWRELGIDALYLGPLFESSRHGYDTADLFKVDRRLGDNALLKKLVEDLHQEGIRVVLDGVFHHVGRDFWAFRDLQEKGPGSAYCSWFSGVDFGHRSPYGDPFTYDAWNGAYDLVKLNLSNPAVREHLLQAVDFWITEFGIDGLRLDAADSVDPSFLRELAAFCRKRRPDFWLMGEVVFGDYSRIANGETLDSTTNYECYKGLFSSHNDANYFEIAHSLQRQFGKGGIYENLSLYSFADNHDVDRIASSLKKMEHLLPLHFLLFTMPGIPSIYYGSEWGVTGSLQDGEQDILRPFLEGRPENPSCPELEKAIARLIAIRKEVPALRGGDYEQVLVSSEQLAFRRKKGEDWAIAAVNSSDRSKSIKLPAFGAEKLFDPLNGESFIVKNDQARITLPPCWGRVLVEG
jgi:glycosidase